MSPTQALNYSFQKSSTITVGRARYAQLAQSLVDSINGGDYPVGSLLPTEAQLCGHFSVSRTTVRQALRQLQDMGLVSSKAGVGTLVRAKYVKPQYVHAVQSVSDIFQYAKASGAPKILVTEEIDADASEAELLCCTVGQRWIKIESTRTFTRQEVPMGLIHAYFPPAFSAALKLIIASKEPMYKAVETVSGEQIYEVEQEFRAVTISARQSRILKVKAGSAGLYAIRHYLNSSGKLMLVTLSVYPADRFSYAMRLRYNPKPTKE